MKSIFTQQIWLTPKFAGIGNMEVNMNHMPVDVIATFNVQGKIKPNYIRLEDESHTLRTYKIEEVILCREEKYAGVPVLFFSCNIAHGDCLQLISIKYHVKTHQWVLVNDEKDNRAI